MEHFSIIYVTHELRIMLFFCRIPQLVALKVKKEMFFFVDEIVNLKIMVSF